MIVCGVIAANGLLLKAQANAAIHLKPDAGLSRATPRLAWVKGPQ